MHIGSRAHKDVEKKYHTLQSKYEELETELFEKNESLTKLTTASKNLFKEYDTLKNQYDAETGAMHRFNPLIFLNRQRCR